MDILFVDTFKQSSFYYFPLGINLLSSIVNTTSHYTSEAISFPNLVLKKKLPQNILLESDFGKIVNYILDKNPKIISFYTLGDSYYISLIVARNIKKINKNIKIIFAGPQASLCSLETLESFDFIDLIAIGEGEKNIINIIDYFNNKEKIENIKGICYKKSDNIVYNEPQTLIESLDDLPMIKLDDDNIPDVMSIESGRGCPYNCTFCCTKTFWRRNTRLKSIDRIIEEIKFYSTQYNIREFDFTHDLFTAKKEHVLKLCNKLIDLGIDIEWTCSARIDRIDVDMAKSMKKAGCKRVHLGIETGSQRMQKKINKNLDMSKVRDKIKIINRCVPVQVNIIYGFPEEGEKDLFQSMDLVKFCVEKTLMERIAMSKCKCYPGTHIYFKNKDNLTLNKKNFNLFNYPSKNHINFIESYPHLFSSLYIINDKLLDKYFYLDTFIRYMYTFLAIKLPRTMNEIITCYNDNLLDFYLEYQEEIQRIDRLLTKTIYYEDKVNHVRKEMLYGLEAFIKYKIENEFMIQLLQFEVEIMKVSLDRDSYVSKVITFDYDMLTYYKESKKKKEECKVTFASDGDEIDICRVM
ncbi:MAG: B12-binding domain-containing radical SAM protein [Clostridia bacterium]|nr:B12-binding domain-containing radical SAM protein [Clostridia bacterium]